MEETLQSKWLKLLSVSALAGLVVFAAVAGLKGLGAYSFWDDEFSHVFAAKGLLEKGKPELPSGWLYTRSLPYTYLVALSFKLFGVSEFSARLPSVLAYLVTIIVVYAVALRLFGWPTALLSSALLAADPLSFVFSRLSRMYSLFVLIFLALSYLVFKTTEAVFRYRGSDFPHGGAKTRAAAWGLSALSLFGFGFVVHPLVVTLLPPLGVYLIWDSVFANKEAKRGLRAMEFLAGFADLAFLVGGYLALSAWITKSLPAAGVDTGVSIYSRAFTFLEPLLIPLFLLGFYLTWKDGKRAGIFFGMVAAVGLSAQGIVFSSRADIRYAVHYVPLMVILAGYGVAAMAAALLSLRSRMNAGGHTFAYGLLVVIAGAVLLAQGTRITAGRADFLGYSNTPDYARAFRRIKAASDYRPSDAVASTIPLASLYYGGKVDYWLRDTDYERFLLRKNARSADRMPKEVYSGAELVTGKAGVQAMIGRTGKGWLVVDTRFKSLSRENRKFIRENMRLFFAEGSSLKVYRWKKGDQ